METTDVFALFQQLCETRKMKPEEAKTLIRESMRAAMERKFGKEVRFDMTFDTTQKKFELVMLKTVVDKVENALTEVSLDEAREEDPAFEINEELEVPINPQTLGRYASYAGRDSLRRDSRVHVRTDLLTRWTEKIGDMVMVEVKSVERGTAFCVIPGEASLEVILPARHQDRSKPVAEGESIEVAILEVKEEKHSIRLVVSESGPEVVLAELKSRVTPEAWAKVQIVKAVREPNRATKIVVESRPGHEDFDAIGALAGPRGALIRRLADELGERIDLMSPSDDIFEMVQMALTPAEIEEVEEDEATGELVAWVQDARGRREAIGERGVNVRLAGKLVGKNIRIESYEGKQERR